MLGTLLDQKASGRLDSILKYIHLTQSDSW